MTEQDKKEIIDEIKNSERRLGRHIIWMVLCAVIGFAIGANLFNH